MMEYKFKLGVSLSLGESPDTDEKLQGLMTSGMEHVEIMYASYCDNPAWATSVKKKLNSTQININSVHAPFSNEVDISRLDDSGQEFALQQVGKAIIMAERMEAGIVVLHGSAEPIGEHERAQRITQSKSSLCILSKQAQASGVRLALELLPRTCLGNSVGELQALLAGISPENAGFCLDTNHPADPNHLNSVVKQLGERIITLHVSDYDGINEKHWMPFRGVVDWGAFANALRDVQYTEAFIYETLPEGNTTEEKLGIIQSNFQKILNTAKEAE